MEEKEQQELVQKIFKTYAEGGSMSHNIVSFNLQKLAKHNKELADKTYETLVSRGF